MNAKAKINRQARFFESVNQNFDRAAAVTTIPEVKATGGRCMSRLIERSKNGMPSTVQSTKVWQSTAKPCVMLLMKTADKSTAWGLSVLAFFDFLHHFV